MITRASVKVLARLAVGAGLLSVVACGGSTAGTTTASETITPQPAAQGAPPVAPAPAVAPPIPIATAVEFDRLVELIPEVSGWTRSKPRGEQLSLGAMISVAKVRYEKGESWVDLELTDTCFIPLIVAPWTMMMGTGWGERTADGYRKAQSMNGHSGFESWENEPKNGEIAVLVANRFLVNAKGRGVDNIEAVRAIVQAVDFGKLAALK